MEEYIIGEFPIEDLMRRFGDFDEAITKDIRLSYGEVNDDNILTLVFEVYDTLADPTTMDEYVKVTFIMKELLQFKINYSIQHTLQMVTHEIAITSTENSIRVEFYPDGKYLPDGRRESRLYCICRHCVVKIEPVD